MLGLMKLFTFPGDRLLEEVPGGMAYADNDGVAVAKLSCKYPFKTGV